MENRLILTLITFHIWQVAGWETSGWGAQPHVEIKNATVYGNFAVTRKGRSIMSFRGIPYAKPPIGPLRFRSPEPLEIWTGPIYADSDPDMCPQKRLGGKLVGKEDCLKLNVYTPQLGGEHLLPVMVYIHGGLFVRGGAQSAYFGPDFLLDHDIVLVVIQYRLGVLGFLSTGDKAAPGNFGLKDQAQALRWVQENIQNFGGNPDRVTIFGQSAGAVSVNFHVLSDYSKGLFQQYIAQSGSAFCPWGFTKSSVYKEYAFILGNNYNCPRNSSEELIACLQTVDPLTLVSDSSVFPPLKEELSITWQPTDEPDIEGAFLTDIPIMRILTKKMQDLPSISGVVKNEGLVLTAFLYANDTLYNSLLSDLDDFFNNITTIYIDDDTTKSIARSVQDFYCKDIDVENRTQVLEKITDIISDAGFIFPEILQLQLIIGRLDSPHYFYSFDYRGKFSETAYVLKNSDNIGIDHTDDIHYLFPLNSSDLEIIAERSAEDYQMIDIMTELWTTFATLGRPMTSYASKSDLWLPYEENDNTHLVIGPSSMTKVQLQTHFLDARMHFWAMQMLKVIFWSG